MAYDHELAERIRKVVARVKGVSEKEMFGGIAFMLGGRMFVGIVKDDLMVRVDPDTWEAVLAKPHARPMDFTGRPMVGYVYVAPAGVRNAAALKAWIERGAEYVRTLPAKQAKQKAKRKAEKPASGRRLVRG